MNNDIKSKKYDKLFSSGREFAYRTHLCKRGELEGSTEEELDEFEKKHEIKFPPVLRSYMRHFGRKARNRDTEYNCAYTLQSLDYAIVQGKRREEWHEMKNVKELLKSNNYKVNYDNYLSEEENSKDTPLLKDLINIDNIFLINYDTYTRTYFFIDGDKENGHIYFYNNYDSVTSNFLSFTDWYRQTLALFIENSAQTNLAELKIVNGKKVAVGPPPKIDYSGGYECIKKAIDYYKLVDKEKIRTKIRNLRREYYKINDKREKNENIILTFNEFEDNFSSFILENGIQI